jgi:hypothetical protein
MTGKMAVDDACVCVLCAVWLADHWIVVGLGCRLLSHERSGIQTLSNCSSTTNAAKTIANQQLSTVNSADNRDCHQSRAGVECMIDFRTRPNGPRMLLCDQTSVISHHAQEQILTTAAAVRTDQTVLRTGVL